jgi:hypothetical protein
MAFTPITVGTELVFPMRRLIVKEVFVQRVFASEEWTTYLACVNAIEDHNTGPEVTRFDELLPLIKDGSVEIENGR